jgi:hypothetical protein
VSNSACLTGRATAFDGRIDIELVCKMHQLKWLANDHACCLATEKSVERTIVYRNSAAAGL